MYEGLEALARSCKVLRKLVTGLSSRIERTRERVLEECMNERRLVVGYFTPQGWKRLFLQPGSKERGVLRYLKKQRQQPRWCVDCCRRC